MKNRSPIAPIRADLEIGKFAILEIGRFAKVENGNRRKNVKTSADHKIPILVFLCADHKIGNKSVACYLIYFDGGSLKETKNKI